MPLTNYADYLTKIDAAQRTLFYKTGAGSGQALMFNSTWGATPDAGATPSAAAALSNASAGALARDMLQDSYTAERYLSRVRGLSNVASGILLIDRLSHQGGLDATSTSAQTTNLPTAALTRYTSGAGVFIGIETYGTVGTTSVTLTTSYTNQAGTSGRTTKAIVFAGAANLNASKLLRVCPLQDSDMGVRSVESVTLSATTGTVGNFGVTLFKPLYLFNVTSQGFPVTSFEAVTSGGWQLPRVQSGACLSLLHVTNMTGQIQGGVDFVEG